MTGVVLSSTGELDATERSLGAKKKGKGSNGKTKEGDDTATAESSSVAASSSMAEENSGLFSKDDAS